MPLTADRARLAAAGQDLAFITVRVENAADNRCPNAAPALSFQVRGAGSFRAVANGDPMSLEPLQPPQMRASHGQLAVVVQAGGKVGLVRLAVSRAGLSRTIAAGAGCDPVGLAPARR